MKYVAPEMNIVMFEADEVIVASGVEATTTTEEQGETPDGGEWW